MIIELRNPEALALQPIRDLFARAFESGKPVAADVFLAAISLSDPNTAVLLGREDDTYKALAVVFLPSSPLYPRTQVYHFYNEGSVRLRNALIDTAVEWVKARGYNSVYVANWSARSDEVWTRAFSRAGQIEKIGSAFRIDI